MGNEMITFTPEMRDRLRARYDEAVLRGEEVFDFDGNDFVMGYVEYLLEYLDSKFDKPSPKDDIEAEEQMEAEHFPVGPHDRSWCG